MHCKTVCFLTPIFFAFIIATFSHAADFPAEWHYNVPGDKAKKLKSVVGKVMPALPTAGWINSKGGKPNFKGKIIVVDFWATWCGPCIASIPHNNEMMKKYGDKGVMVVGICTAGKQELFDAVVKQRNIQYPSTKDPGNKSATAWNVCFYPTYAVVDRSGVVRGIGLRPNAVDKAVEFLLSEKKQPSKQTTPQAKSELPKANTSAKPKAGIKTITTKAADGIPITADHYSTGDATKPVIVLFHMAGGSRGEYDFLAPNLVKEGFNCLAVDLRSGKGGERFNDKNNATAAAAKKTGKGTKFLDAYKDMKRSVAWARELGYSGKVIVLGSSYSASLSLVLAAELGDGLTAAVAMSPGEYFPDSSYVSNKAKLLTIPVLVSYPAYESKKVKRVVDAVPEDVKTVYVQKDGSHGSKTFQHAIGGKKTLKELLAFLKKR